MRNKIVADINNTLRDGPLTRKINNLNSQMDMLEAMFDQLPNETQDEQITVTNANYALIVKLIDYARRDAFSAGSADFHTDLKKKLGVLPHETVEVSEPEVLRRVNRRLQHDERELKRHDGGHAREAYFLFDTYSEEIVDEFVNLEQQARKLRCLEKWERIAS